MAVRVGARSATGRTRRFVLTGLRAGLTTVWAERGCAATVLVAAAGLLEVLAAVAARRIASVRAFLARISRSSALLDILAEGDAADGAAVLRATVRSCDLALSASARRSVLPRAPGSGAVRSAGRSVLAVERLSLQAGDGLVARRAGSGRRHAAPSREAYVPAERSGAAARRSPPLSRRPSWCPRRRCPTRPARQPPSQKPTSKPLQRPMPEPYEKPMLRCVPEV